MLYKWQLVCCLLCLLLLPAAQAQTPPLPIDLIELLGELDDEDSESLAAALADVQAEQNNTQSQPLPQETKK
ncbi:MAG TPA: hypothetical protein PL131_09395 [Methylotenera sp.]|nr:hypothetical protein [Methylotenera sp.]HPH06077.1 hypothetical protein [Methylotenera sp.]HPN00916.1 hypothetical protein [Methylotenera sp.]